MNALFIGAHTDDVELACGGTIQKIGGYCMPLSYCGKSVLIDEFKLSAGVLQAKYVHPARFQVRTMAERYNDIATMLHFIRDDFDTIFTHDISDIHPDHKTVAEQSVRIFKTHNVLTYLSPWNGNEQPDYFVEITQEHLDRKIEALSCYKSQARRPYMAPDFIIAQARYMGVKCGKQYAEGFKVHRLVN